MKPFINMLRSYEVKGKIFHPSVGIVSRFGCLMSGSGLTNTLGTFVSNMNVLLFNQVDKGTLLHYASGDDLIIALEQSSPKPESTFDRFISFSQSYSNISYASEYNVNNIGNDFCEFLGSV